METRILRLTGLNAVFEGEAHPYKSNLMKIDGKTWVSEVEVGNNLKLQSI